VETTKTQITVLRQLPIGGRLLIRSKHDWRTAVVSCHFEDKVTILVCSPSGRTYRLRRAAETQLIFEGGIPLIEFKAEENWRENFTKYDVRW